MRSVSQVPCAFWIIVLNALCCHGIPMTTYESASLSMEVSNYFHVQGLYVVLLNNTAESELSQYPLLAEFIKTLGRNTRSAMIITPSAVLFSLDTFKQNNDRPLYVILSNGHDSNSFFKKVSENGHMARAVWLVLLDVGSESLDFLFSGVDIPFNCELIVARFEEDHVLTLVEVYRVAPILPLQTYRFGNWSGGTQLNWPTVGLYHRRNDLQKLIMKTGTINDNPIRITKELNGKPMQVGGYYGDVWQVLESKLNFTSDYFKPMDEAYGALQDNGSWSGLIAMLLRNEVHVANVDFYWTRSRMEVVDFIAPITQFRMRVYVRKPDSHDLQWTRYVTPFSPGLWVAVTGCVIIFSAALCIIDYVLQGTSKCLYVYTLLHVFGAFCYQARNTTPHLLSGRIIYLVTYVTAVVTVISYSASLVSSIMVQSDRTPFKNFKEFLMDGTYSLGMQSSSAELDYFKKSSNPLMQEIYKRHVAPHEKSLPHSSLEGLEKVCSSHNYAWMIADINAITYMKQLSCKLMEIPYAFMPASASMAIQKNGPYKDLMKLKLYEMHHSGLLQILRSRNFPRYIVETDSEFHSVSLTQVIPISVALLAGLVTSTLFLVLERISFRKTLKNKIQAPFCSNHHSLRQ